MWNAIINNPLNIVIFSLFGFYVLLLLGVWAWKSRNTPLGQDSFTDPDSSSSDRRDTF